MRGGRGLRSRVEVDVVFQDLEAREANVTAIPRFFGDFPDLRQSRQWGILPHLPTFHTAHWIYSSRVVWWCLIDAFECNDNHPYPLVFGRSGVCIEPRLFSLTVTYS